MGYYLVYEIKSKRIVSTMSTGAGAPDEEMVERLVPEEHRHKWAGCGLSQAFAAKWNWDEIIGLPQHGKVILGKEGQLIGIEVDSLEKINERHRLWNMEASLLMAVEEKKGEEAMAGLLNELPADHPAREKALEIHEELGRIKRQKISDAADAMLEKDPGGHPGPLNLAGKRML